MKLFGEKEGALTGRKRHRRTLFGKIVLQVEFIVLVPYLEGGGYRDSDKREWRDAKANDMQLDNLMVI